MIQISLVFLSRTRNDTNYFKDAEYGKANTCEPTKHMNLYAENAVEVHVDTTANALKFKVSASNPKDIFLNHKPIPR